MSIRTMWFAALVSAGCGVSMVSLSDAGAGGGVGGGGAAGGGVAGGGAAGGGAAGGGVAGGGAAGGSAGGGGVAGGGAAGGGASGGGVAGGGASGGGAFGGGVSSGDGGVVPLAGGETCALAPDVTAGGRFSGTTNGFADDYSVSGPGCPAGGAASGRDVAYRLSPAVARVYTVRVTPVPATLADGGSNRFDPMLVVQRACGQSGCVTGTILNGPGDPEAVTISVSAGDTVYVIVDGERGTRGEFELEVSF